MLGQLERFVIEVRVRCDLAHVDLPYTLIEELVVDLMTPTL